MAIIRVSDSGSESTDSDYDSGMESDEFDLSDLGDSNCELCQVGNSSFSVPVEVFDLEDLSDILNTDTWNNILIEKDRFQLANFLPDMDYETFSKTLSQLFSGENFHFCRPFSDFFNKMKGGLLNPRVVLTNHGFIHLKRREYYHSLMMYQNRMVRGFTKARDAWEDYVGCGIEEKLCVLNKLQNRKDLEYEHLKSNTDMENSGHGLKQIVYDDEDYYDERVNVKLIKGRKKNEVLRLPKYNIKGGGNNQCVTVAAYNPHSLKTINNAKYQPKGERSSKGKKWNNISSAISKYATYGQNGALFSSNSEETESESEEDNGVMNQYQNSSYGLKKGANSAKLDRNMELNGIYKSEAIDGNHVEDVVLVKKTSVMDAGAKYLSYVSDKKRKGIVEVNHHPLNYTKYYVANALNMDSGVYENSNMPLLACNSMTKKQKGNPSASKQEVSMHQFDEANFMKKKDKKKADSVDDPSVVPDTILLEKEAVIAEPEPPKPQKKQYIPITPTKHTEISFSIVHLLTAVRKAMITPNVVGDTQASLEPKPVEGDNKVQEPNKDEIMNSSAAKLNEVQNVNPSPSEPLAKENTLLCFTIQEIVIRVRKIPGDPHIIETQEPLNDLVRGVLKLFSSKTAPLGAKAWKPLVSYEKLNKTWTWVGPVSSSLHDSIDFNEETSPEAWGLPYKTMVKLVDSFATWFKCGQETLKLIGSLPPPPTTFLPEMDEKERFRDLRAQKSLNTIKPSSEEVRKYFRCEELLRYTIPDRAFSYTTADGKKSIVAPLRKGGGKPTAKAREHPILKPDRPPHVTILCLVRDAAARLPGSIGTRADVCTLIRDSQYVVEDVADEEVTKVVSGALDRLHYERDPCVQFQSERKLWVYLHKDREEEDFEDDGTSSTKKWKRPRKDASEQTAQTETVAEGNETSTPMAVDQAMGGYDLSTNVNANILSSKEETYSFLVYNDMRPNVDESIQPFVDLPQANLVQGNAMSWDPVVKLNPLQENQLICKENSIDVLNDEAFSRDMQAGFLNASFL